MRVFDWLVGLHDRLFVWFCIQLERAIDNALPDYVAEEVDD